MFLMLEHVGNGVEFSAAICTINSLLFAMGVFQMRKEKISILKVNTALRTLSFAADAQGCCCSCCCCRVFIELD